MSNLWLTGPPHFAFFLKKVNKGMQVLQTHFEGKVEKEYDIG
jgi:hypothetical protein